MAKVALVTDDDTETLWAEPAGPGLYRLCNCPFFAYGYSWGDIVETVQEGDDFPVVTRVAEKGGHRTIRINSEKGIDSSPEDKAILDGVLALGAGYECFNDKFIVIDIEPDADLMAVGEYFTEHGVEWEHADPTYEDLYQTEES